MSDDTSNSTPSMSDDTSNSTPVVTGDSSNSTPSMSDDTSNCTTAVTDTNIDSFIGDLAGHTDQQKLLKNRSISKSKMKARLAMLEKLGTQFPNPKPPQQGKSCDPGDLGGEVREVLHELHPRLKDLTDPFSQKQFDSLADTIQEVVTSDIKSDGLTLKDKSKKICEKILQMYPTQDFNQLLHRWARRKGAHDFVKECIHCLYTMTGLLKESISLTDFLTECRTWKIFPSKNTKGKRSRLRIHFVPPDIPAGHKYDSIAFHIDVSIRLMYVNLSTMNSTFLSKVRHVAPNKPVPFAIPKVPHDASKLSGTVATRVAAPDPFNEIQPNRSNPRETSNTGPKKTTNNKKKTKEDPRDCYTFETDPVLGFHMPNSFKSKLWLCIQTLKAGFYLYMFVFRLGLMKSNLYSERANTLPEKAFQFFISSSSHLQTRYLFTRMLFYIAVVFDDVNDIAILQDYLLPSMQTDDEGRLPKGKLDELIQNKLPEPHVITERIVATYRKLDTITSRPRYFDTKHSMSYTSDFHFTALRCVVFDLWFTLPSNDTLKKEVHTQLGWLPKPKEVTGPRGGKKKCTQGSTISPWVRTGMDLQVDKPKHHLPSITEQQVMENLEQPSIIHPPPKPAQKIAQLTYSDIVKDPDRFPSLKIVDSSTLQARLTSLLSIQTNHKVIDVVLTPFEVYSAKGLRRHPHQRLTQTHNRDLGKARVVVGPSVLSYVDPMDDTVAVVRRDSSILKMNDLRADFPCLVEFVSRRGSIDQSRRDQSHSRSIEIGVKPELDSANNTFIYGQQHLAGQPEESAEWTITREKAKESLAAIVNYLWSVGQEIQRTLGKPQMGGCHSRYEKYGLRLSQILGCQPEGTLRQLPEFESVTLVHMLLPGGCTQHCDKLNDDTYNYSSTVCLDVVLIDHHQDLHLLQVLGNFRKHCGHRVIPGLSQKFEQLSNHFKAYHKYLADEYVKKLVKMDTGAHRDYSFVRNPLDLDGFFLDDDLPWEKLSILSDKHPPVVRELLKIPIGTSRTLSLSGILDVLHQASRTLMFDQLLELCFFSCFVSTPVLVYDALTGLLDSNQLHHSKLTHPMYLMARTMSRLFPSIHSGVNPRFSSGSNKIMTHFNVEDGRRDRELVQLCQALTEWVNFLDRYQGYEDANDIPFKDVLKQMDRTCEKVKKSLGKIKYKAKAGDGTGKVVEKESELDFSLFRLSIFTTIVSGLGIAKPGRHLHQVIIPTVKTAAVEHLTAPGNGEIEFRPTSEVEEDEEFRPDLSKTLKPEEVDLQMRELAGVMGLRRYRRDVVELYLCESKMGRYLAKMDVFRKGQSIFVLSDYGVPMRKAYGRNKCWLPLDTVRRNYKFLWSGT